MAGTVTVAVTAVDSLLRYLIDWTSDAAGAVSGTAVGVAGGELLQVTHTPDSGGTQPANLFDVTITNAGGEDILGGTGANLVNTGPTTGVPVVSTFFRRILTAGAYTPVVANAGNAKGGTIELLLRPI